ncbi:Retinol dehydrogenase 12 [Mycena indigotica]|uniref:Retinol dehydrogenase 12 n=1 Tax=Mycena indigotica TaxID=2126181 RepID=A0A8H6W1W7_9AGAR|nr:Retinol dehydrogenase 12 [Mycena indigotica]KAF7298638.1 Retinol dehydrogenase 12 [Mycena indigotica]
MDSISFILIPQPDLSTHTVSRVVGVSSEAHYWASFDKKVWTGSDPIIRTLGGAAYHQENGSSAIRARYPITKLLNVFFTRALAARVSPHRVVVNTVTPGMCKTELARDLPVILRPLVWLMHTLLGFTAEQGSRQLIFGAVAEPAHPEKLHGQFIMGSKPTEPSDFVLSDLGKKSEELLWEEVVEILDKVDPKVKQVAEEYLARKI